MRGITGGGLIMLTQNDPNVENRTATNLDNNITSNIENCITGMK